MDAKLKASELIEKFTIIQEVGVGNTEEELAEYQGKKAQEISLIIVDEILDELAKNIKVRAVTEVVTSRGFMVGSKDSITFDHPATFPEYLAYYHIKSWSNENDIILDPFMGSGTTAKCAHLLNRKFIGFEISKEYCELIQKRLNPHINNLFSGLGSVLDYS